MDDTLCAYSKAHRQAIQRCPAQGFPQAEIDFFRRLEPIPGALEGLIKLARYYDTFILTRPSVRNPLSYAEKRIWIEEKLGMLWVERLFLAPDKSHFRGILVDDTPCPGFEGRQLLFGSEAYPSWKEVLASLCPDL